MDSLKNKIVKILYDNSVTSYGKGSCGELGDSYLSVDADSFNDVADEIMKIIINKKDIDKKDSFEQASIPLMEYLGNNHHPHTSAYVTNNRAELLEGQEVFTTDRYVLD